MTLVNGTFPAAADTVIGRFPWRTLGLPPIRDGYGECLWYAISAGHKSTGINPAIKMNWDALGQLDLVNLSSGALVPRNLQEYERPVAIIFSPGPQLGSQSRGSIGSDATDECKGNYAVGNYLEAAALLPLFNSTNAASGDAGVTPKPMSTEGKLVAGSNVLANDIGLTITADTLFRQIRKNSGFRSELRLMLQRMANCWKTQLASLSTPTPNTDFAPPAGKVALRIPDAPAACSANIDTAYGNDVDPKGYFNHYREMIFIARPEPSSNTFTVNGDASCKGVILFSGPRAAGQQRISITDQKNLANYLEGSNLSAMTGSSIVFAGDVAETAEAPRQEGTDIAICIPAATTAPPDLVLSQKLTAPNLGQLVAYEAATNTLTLGRQDMVTGNSLIGSANAGALYGCAWMTSGSLGNGLRSYFRFQFKRLGTNVGSNGFVFALIDAERNGVNVCGMAGSHLGYSGSSDDGIPPAEPPTLLPPKIGIEFDQGRNTGFPGSGGEASTDAGRNDPCGTSAAGCAGLGYNSHAAIVYWGNEAGNPTDGVSLPSNDDNVHGFPANPPALRPPPANPGYPSNGFAFKDLRGQQGGGSYLYHVRIEVTPTRLMDAAAENSRTVVQTRVWILADSMTVANQIIAMKNTTRSMGELYPGFNPTLSDSQTLYDVPTAGSYCDAVTSCTDSQICGAGNLCYRQSLRKLRLGFTNAQRTTDQEVSINDFSTAWLP